MLTEIAGLLTDQKRVMCHEFVSSGLMRAMEFFLTKSPSEVQNSI